MAMQYIWFNFVQQILGLAGYPQKLGYTLIANACRWNVGTDEVRLRTFYFPFFMTEDADLVALFNQVICPPLDVDTLGVGD
jgi:hypothetical protein